MLNKYIWNLYLKSGGNKVVEMFRRNLSEKLTLEYAEEVVRMRRVYCVMSELQLLMREQIEDLIRLYGNKQIDILCFCRVFIWDYIL